jgi:hypothetical protein
MATNPDPRWTLQVASYNSTQNVAKPTSQTSYHFGLYKKSRILFPLDWIQSARRRWRSCLNEEVEKDYNSNNKMTICYNSLLLQFLLWRCKYIISYMHGKW